MTMKAVILFAHGARHPEWAKPIQAIRLAMQEKSPSTPVVCAFLEFLEPALPQAIDALVSEGLSEIVVVPVFMAQTGHTQRDLPVLIDAARARHPGLSLRVSAPVGEAATVVDAMAVYALGV